MKAIPVPDAARIQMPWATTLEIGPPPGHEAIPTLEDCGWLPSLVEQVPGEPVRIRSYWRPSAAEMERLSAGGAVELTAVTPVMVPVSVAVPYDTAAPYETSGKGPA